MIEVLNLQPKYSINRAKFRKLLVRLVNRYKLDDPEISLSFVTTKTIKKLNRKFLKKDEATDVLSFPVGKKGPDGKFYLGDIIISVPQAFKQCLAQAHGLEKELLDLTIHGFLHLMGYEHGGGIEGEEAKVRGLFKEA